MTTVGFQTLPGTSGSSGPSYLIDIGRDFSETPGGRYKKLGPYSGELFRAVLAPRLRSAIDEGELLRVRIDTVRRSYQPSFLDEAFAGLIRDEGFSKTDLDQHLIIVADLDRFKKYKALAERYIDEVT